MISVKEDCDGLQACAIFGLSCRNEVTMLVDTKTRISLRKSIYKHGIPGFFLLGFLLLTSFCSPLQRPEFISQWQFSPDGPWLGPELWANRLQDWRVASGQLECLSSLPMRTVHLTTMRLKESGGHLRSKVIVRKLAGGNDSSSAVGFLVGAGKDLDYRSA
jgi:alkaline phosphatase D